MLVVILITTIDVISYAILTKQKITDVKTKTAHTVLLGIKSAILRGDLIEASNFLYSLKRGNFIECFKLDLKKVATDDCETNLITAVGKDSEKFIIQYDNNVYGDVLLHFNFTQMRQDFYFRVLFGIFLSFVLYALLFYIFNLISNTLIKEVDLLRLSVEVRPPERTSLKFKIQDFYSINEQLLENLRFRESIQFQSALVTVAAQVSHDIRSPLSALNMITATLKDVPEEKRLIIRNAVQRINDIANQLLQKSKESAAQSSSADISASDLLTTNTIALKKFFLSPLIDEIISEKRIQYRDKMNVDISSDFSHSYGEFAMINSNELKRVLSNLINNSVEAFAEQKGKIIVSINNDHNSDQNTVSIVVHDNGKGMSPHILAKLGDKGVSHGKDGTNSGSGLGIYHAKKAIESFNGQFEVLSKVGMGTTITMSFPKAAAPSWFVEKLVLPSSSQVVSLDDDLSIHQIWKGRLQSLNAESLGVRLLSFTSGSEFKNYILAQTDESTGSQNKDATQKIFLVDYELLNQNMTGLDLIEELGLGDNSILVTSRYEEEHIQNRCAKLGVKLIPKGMAGFVPIKITQPKIKYDAVLIDDDELIHMTWQMMAKEKNKSVILFKTEAEFLAVASAFDKTTPLYIDVNLANGVSGIDVAKRIHALGFSKLYLATGYAEIEKPSFITAVVGKEPQV